MSMYPAGAADRDRFVLDRRPPRAAHDPWQSHGVVFEEERSAEGAAARVATVFLTGRECPWRCVMCDLWQHTTLEDTPGGATAAQVAAARHVIDRSPDPVSVVKLYNAGSFFDSRAVPEGDYSAVAGSLSGLARVIVESHPALVGARTRRFLDDLRQHAAESGSPPRLEVAMGLETAHPDALSRLHKRMSLEDFRRAAGRLADLGADLRVFLLVSPPFVPREQQDDWLLRSIDAALACGASAISLIPTRTGNGAMNALADAGWFLPPRLVDVERSLSLALARVAGTGARVFADLRNLDMCADCGGCLEARRSRLQAANLEQRTHPPVACEHCGSREHR
jgi:radical SAM enzyme (TIGR01210 family)